MWQIRYKPLHLIETASDVVFLQGAPPILLRDVLKGVAPVTLDRTDSEAFHFRATTLLHGR